MTQQTVALVGAPNVGKSVLFNALAKDSQTVSNYPGTTVSVARAPAEFGGQSCELIDTPGMYSLFPASEEERVARDILLNDSPDLVLHVVDGKSLKQSLPFTLQLLEAGQPVVPVVNMMDEVRDSGLKLDVDDLRDSLGLPVVATTATTGEGLSELESMIERKLTADYEPSRDADFESPEELVLPRENYGLARGTLRELLLRGDAEFKTKIRENEPGRWPQIEASVDSYLEAQPGSPELEPLRRRHREAQQICESAVDASERHTGWGERLGKIAARPLTGWPILFVVLYLGIYQFVGVFGAQTVVDYLEQEIFGGIVNPFIAGHVEQLVPWQPIVELLVGKFGVITHAITYAIALILPIVAFFFLVFSIIEDSGYLPRIALLLDRTFKKIGLSGRAVIPMVLGLGCDTMATMVTRTLDSRRQRLISNLLLALAIPCSAQLGVILGILSGNTAALLIWVGTITGVFLFIGFLSSLVFPGDNSSFYMQLPPLRLPKISNVIAKTYARVKWYFLEVFPLFILASLLIWFGRLTGLFGKALKLIAYPARWVGLPTSSAKIFLYGFFRRDYGAAGLYDLIQEGVLNSRQMVVASVVLTLFVPCIAQFIMTGRERGWPAAVAMGLFVFSFAFVVGFALNQFLIFVPLGV